MKTSVQKIALVIAAAALQLARHVLDMVTDFVRNDIRLCKITGSAEAIAQVREKAEIDVYGLIARAVEWPHGGLTHAARRLHHAAEGDDLRLRIILPRLLEIRAPGVFGTGQHSGGKLEHGIVRGRLLIGLLR